MQTLKIKLLKGGGNPGKRTDGLGLLGKASSCHHHPPDFPNWRKFSEGDSGLFVERVDPWISAGDGVQIAKTEAKLFY